MIELHTDATPNGRKASIMLEELGLYYEVHKVDIGAGDQFKPEFLKISPNNKIPAIIDRDAEGDPISVFESGAILIYLAEKTGSALLPSSGPARVAALEWLMMQMGGVGPMFGQFGHFVAFAPEKVPYAINRYKTEAARILGVLDRRLAENEYLAGDYSIADIATYPWLDGLDFYLGRAEETYDFPETPNLNRWKQEVGTRDAVTKGMALLKNE